MDQDRRQQPPLAPRPPQPPRIPPNTLAADRAAPRAALAVITPFSTLTPLALPSANIDFPVTIAPLSHPPRDLPLTHIATPTVRAPPRQPRAPQTLLEKNIENIHPHNLIQLGPAIAAAHYQKARESKKNHRAANPVPEALLRSNLHTLPKYGRGGNHRILPEPRDSYSPRAMRIELEKLFWNIHGSILRMTDRAVQRQAMEARGELFRVLEKLENSGKKELKLGEEGRAKIRDSIAKAGGMERFMMQDYGRERAEETFNEEVFDLDETQYVDMGFDTKWASWYSEMLMKLDVEMGAKAESGELAVEEAERRRRVIEREKQRVMVEWDRWKQRMDTRARGLAQGQVTYMDSETGFSKVVEWSKQGTTWNNSDGVRIGQGDLAAFEGYLMNRPGLMRSQTPSEATTSLESTMSTAPVRRWGRPATRVATPGPNIGTHQTPRYPQSPQGTSIQAQPRTGTFLQPPPQAGPPPNHGRQMRGF